MAAKIQKKEEKQKDWRGIRVKIQVKNEESGKN